MKNIKVKDLLKAKKKFEKETGQIVTMVRVNQPWGEIVVTTADGRDHVVD